MEAREFSQVIDLQTKRSELVLSRKTALEFYRKRRIAQATGATYPGLLQIPHMPDGRISFKELARLLNLPTPLHIDITKGRARLNSRYACCHITDEPTPSFPLCPGLGVAIPEEAIYQMCVGSGFARQALLAYELCGSFAISPAEKDGFINDLEPITAPELICEHVATKVGNRNSPRFRNLRRVTDSLCAGAASPAEARLCLAIVAPRTLGGQGLPKPELNAEILVENTGAALTQRRVIRPDEFWRELDFILEYMGYRHADVERMGEDASRDNTLSAMGYKVVHVTKRQVQDPNLYAGLMEYLRRELGVRKDIPSQRIVKEQEALRAALFGTSRDAW